MLVFDMNKIGEALFRVRKAHGMTQAEVAEAAELSDRTYADIERGSTNMRVETLLKICAALHITPNDILTAEERYTVSLEEVFAQMSTASARERETAAKLLKVYADSLQ